MRDQLIGYLLDALEPSEQELVEAQLNRDPRWKQELELLSRSLKPLAADKAYYEPPVGLVHRTCEFVAAQSKVLLAPPAAAVVPSRWTFADLVVAAGIFVAAAMLFFPAVNQSRFAARLSGCQNNLRQIGMALGEYSGLHHGCFPNVPLNGSLAAAGIYGPRLVDHGFISNPGVLICPASQLANLATEFRVPTCQELERTHGEQLIRLHRAMGGSYGYTLGYVANNVYQPTRNLQRPNFAIMADAPASEAPFHSLNHGGCGQNVLFEDGHVQYLTTCKAHGFTDNIFLNDEGEPKVGVHMHDAVIGASHSKPLLPPNVIKALQGR